MRLIVLGPQGSGKGTQAESLAALLGVPHIETGAMIRAEIAAGTALGKELQVYNDRGELVPDDIIIRAVTPLVTGPRGWILDGFPRTLGQARSLDTMLAASGYGLDAVIALAAPDEELIARMAGRRYSASTGLSYHLTTNPPPPGDPGPFVQRVDDTPERMRRRLQLYHARTEPLIAHYAACGLLHTVDASGPIEAVTKAIVADLGLAA